MNVIIEPRGSKNIYCASFHHNGKHVRRSLKTSNRETATKNLNLVLREFNISQPVGCLTGGIDQVEQCRIIDGLHLYLDHLRDRNCPNKTIVQATTRVSAFISHLQNQRLIYLTEIRPLHADTFFRELKKQKSINTAVGYFRFVKSMLTFLKSRQLISGNPFSDISFQRIEHQKTPIPDMNTVNMILKRADQTFLVPLTAIALLGCRVDAFTRIEKSHVDLVKGTVFIQRPTASRGSYLFIRGCSRFCRHIGERVPDTFFVPFLQPGHRADER